MQDRPTAVELLDAVAGLLEQDLAPLLDARMRFHARVAVNVLGILQREWELGPGQVARSSQLLSGLLGHQDEAAALWGQLAVAIRRGDFDDRQDELIPILREITAMKLAIANPGYASTDHRRGGC